ncbi:hypothetical protein GZH82_04940 [Staphylococcus ursi]|uniref:chorismate mutase n=1 Tax=Staphylococcus sp. MI 10-1553 TaxID=1912064 RepID=UPI0013987A69|nr:chorismate mutase [Staphylococcus sp. MI 10-1553]QHW36750.1 hypothetical protein GZH82_04940 [Staphylococcus sp. MI 10-1553]
MMRLANMREKINEIDEGIIHLLNERMNISKMIGIEKKIIILKWKVDLGKMLLLKSF